MSNEYKAKVIAARHFLSGINTDEEASASFDALSGSEGLPEGIDVWQPFEEWSDDEVFEVMLSLYEAILFEFPSAN